MRPPVPEWARRDWLIGAAVFILVFGAYNANCREIPSYDSLPTKVTAIEFARYHQLTLDRPVALTPALASRPGFLRDRDGHFRSAYSVFPALLASGVASVLHLAKIVDLRAPLAPSLVAKLTASLLVALGVAMAYVVARRRLGRGAAVLIAVGLGLGTNFWAVASQTLWQTETVAATLAGVVACLAVPSERLTVARLWLASLLLGCAGATRPQIAPVIAVLALAIVVRRHRVSDLFALLPLAGVAACAMWLNVRWFGDPFGAFPRLELLHPGVHAVSSSLGNPLVGIPGLLVSPNRGLVVFSPVVLVALAALPAMRREGVDDDLHWWAMAASVQICAYGCYSVWWGGHTYGPRYLLDVLPLLVPLAAAGLPWMSARRWRRAAGIVALAWSVTVAVTGALVYPHELWNSDPDEIDLNHARVWDWRDLQVVCCWKAGFDPRNFILFSRAAIHQQSIGGR